MKDLKDKVAVVTGGSSGIGFSIAKALAKEGVHIVIASLEMKECEKAAEQIAEYGVKATPFQCDVTQRKNFEDLANFAWNTFNHVDIIVNNAGVISDFSPLIEANEQDFRWQLEVNLISQWVGCSVFAKRFIKQGTPAHIVNVASENCFYPALPFNGFYIASKHAVFGMTDTLRMELPSFINVSLLACGLADTALPFALEKRLAKFGGAIFDDGATKERAKKVMSQGMKPDEIGKKTVEGIKRNDFYIVTHPHNLPYINKRYKEIVQAYKNNAPHFDGDEKYDAIKIMTKIYTKIA